MITKNKSIYGETNTPSTITTKGTVSLTDIIGLSDEKVIHDDQGKGRELKVSNSTYVIDDGTYKGMITNAFWYKTSAGKDRVMLFIKLEDGTEFMNSVNGEWIDDYPYSKLISQVNAKHVGDLVGHKVIFEIRNNESDTKTFSNIKKISLDA